MMRSRELCTHIHLDDLEDPSEATSVLGDFVAAWAGLERSLMGIVQRHEARVLSTVEAIRTLGRLGILDPWTVEELDRIRLLRNAVVHGHDRPGELQLREAVTSIRAIRPQIEAKRGQADGSTLGPS